MHLQPFVEPICKVLVKCDAIVLGKLADETTLSDFSVLHSFGCGMMFMSLV